MAEKSPCYHCTREIKCATCHSTCPDYIVWSAFHNIELDEINKAKMLEAGLYGQREQLVRKANKMRRDKK